MQRGFWSLTGCCDLLLSNAVDGVPPGARATFGLPAPAPMRTLSTDCSQRRADALALAYGGN